MEDNPKLLESLLEEASEYGRITYELAKLKSVDKASDVVSSFIPHTVVFVLIASFLLLFNLGLAFWIGDIIGEIYYGFFIVSGFYGLIGLIIHLFMHKRLKKTIYIYLIKQLLK